MCLFLKSEDIHLHNHRLTKSENLTLIQYYYIILLTIPHYRDSFFLVKDSVQNHVIHLIFMSFWSLFIWNSSLAFLCPWWHGYFLRVEGISFVGCSLILSDIYSLSVQDYAVVFCFFFFSFFLFVKILHHLLILFKISHQEGCDTSLTHYWIQQAVQALSPATRTGWGLHGLYFLSIH